MLEQEAQLLREHGLAFFGRILAGQTHELTNVLNIINELAGLQADVLAAAGQTRTPDIEKLKRVTEKVRHQLRRGETIVRSLNRFAHSVDGPVSIFDLREALEQTTDLAQRAANLARTVLDQEFPARSTSLETSLFGFTQAVFLCIEMALTASAEQRRITVGYQVLDSGVDITVVSADPIPPGPAAPENRALLGLLVRELGGQVVAEPVADAHHRLTLFFPRPRPRPHRAAGANAGDNAEATHGS